MKPHGPGEAGFDRLVREALRRPGAAAQPCPPASDLAAFLEGAMTVDQRGAFERHLASCDRCQDTLAHAAAAPEIEPARSRPWLQAVPLRWLLPAAAVGAAAVITYVVVGPTLTSPPSVATLKIAERAAGSRAEEVGHAAPGAPAAVSPPPSTGVGSAESSRRQPTKDQQAVPRAADHDTAFAPAPSAKPEAREGERTRARPEAPARPAPAGGVAGGVVGGIVPGAAPPVSPANAANAPEPRENVANVPAPVPPLVAYESQQVAAKGQARLQAADGRAQAAPAGQEALPPGQQAQAAPTVQAPGQPLAAQAPPLQQTPTSQQAPAAQQGGAAGGTDATARADAARAPRAVGLAESLVVTGPVDFASPEKTVVWRIVPAGQVFRSQDGGRTWQEQRPGGAAVYLAGSAPSDAVCWLVGRRGALAVTADGVRWAQPAFPETADLVRVQARDSARAIVTARDGRRFETADGGASWRALR